MDVLREAGVVDFLVVFPKDLVPHRVRKRFSLLQSLS